MSVKVNSRLAAAAALLLGAGLSAGVAAQTRPKAAVARHAAASAPAQNASQAAIQNSTAAAPDPEAGRQKAEAERCNECHGPQGQGDGHTGDPQVRFPRLAGQHAGYLVQQLANYRSGQRKHDVMRINTRDLTDKDLRDLAAFYAALPPMREAGVNSKNLSAISNGPAPSLFTQGDAARGIVACASCHGSEGLGQALPAPASQIPRLAGQDARYLEEQLKDWRNAWRTEPKGGAMNQVTRQLSDAEILQLAAYLAGLRPAP